MSTANDLTIVDVLADQVTAVSESGGGTVAPTAPGNPDTITWTLADLDPGESPTFTYTVVLDTELDANDLITNTATVRERNVTPRNLPARTDEHVGVFADRLPGYVDAAASELHVGGPTITKTALDPLNTVGSETDYQIVAVFPPNINYGSVTITDDLADGSTIWVEDLNAACTGCTAEDVAAFVPNSSPTAPVWVLGDNVTASSVSRHVRDHVLGSTC